MQLECTPITPLPVESDFYNCSNECDRHLEKVFDGLSDRAIFLTEKMGYKPLDSNSSSTVLKTSEIVANQAEFDRVEL